MQSAEAGRPICWLVSGHRTVLPLEDLPSISAISARLTGDIVPLSDGGALISIESGALVIMPVLRPLPRGSILSDRLQEAIWPSWQAAAAAWQSHVIISTLQDVKLLPERRALISDILAISVEFGAKIGADGLGWESSRIFVPFAAAQQTIKDTSLPAQLLVRCQKTADTITTFGLRGFDLPEVRDMTKATSLEAGTARLLNIASYLIKNGDILRNGDTIGVDERRLARVYYTNLPDGYPLLELHDC